ncbi:unnamed protein product [Cercospora beticola]|nr:unnamed protein product [Cercospora beticola]
MSYYQGGHYQQQPPQQPPSSQQPQQTYQYAYDDYQQPAHNGGQYGQAQEPYQYQSQSGYSQYPSGGGPVQQPASGYAYQQEPYQSPRATSFSYAQQPAYSQQYNPQDYAPQPTHTQSAYQQPTYNPAAYASVGQQSSYGNQYNSAAYAQTGLSSTSGPVDPYAYSPGTHSTASFSSQPPPSNYGQSPQLPYSPQAQQQYSPQPQSHQYTYPQSPPPPPPPSHTAPYPSYGYSQASPGASTSAPYPIGDYPAQPSPAYTQTAVNMPTAIPSSRPDETWLPSPPIHGSLEHRPSVSHSSGGRPSPITGEAAPPPPAHAPSRTGTLNRHPQERPLPSRPAASTSPDYFDNGGVSRTHTGFSSNGGDLNQTQDELFDELMEITSGRGSLSGRSPSISLSQAPAQYSPVATRQDSRAGRNGALNGHLSPVSAQHRTNAQYSDDSDAEAAQGLAMMRQAEEDETRRQSGGTQVGFSSFGSQQPSRFQQGDAHDSDGIPGVDMTSISGGYDVHLPYGDPLSNLPPGRDPIDGYNHNTGISSQQSSMRRSHASQSSSRGDYGHRTDSLRYFNPQARVEVGGTGGLSEPTADGRRHSYDEGDEYSFMEGLPERFPDEPPDIGFQAASVAYPSRPLPAVPYPEDELPQPGADHKALPPLPGQPPYAPDAYPGASQAQLVPRSTSLVNHSSTPQVMQPLRSKTDAEERRIRQQQQRNSGYSTEQTTPAAASMLVDLPAIGKRFSAVKLGAADFKKCEEPWALTQLLKWLLQVTNPEQNTELKEADIREALVALFTNKVPTMNIADAETLSGNVVDNMYKASVLVATEEWVKLLPGPFSGVIFQLTKLGCYSPTVHNHVIPNMRCYSHHCQRTLKKINLQAAPSTTSSSWQEYYKLSKEEMEARDKKEVERQNILHEIVYTEEVFMANLDVLRVLYRDQLARVEPSVITPQRKDGFIRAVFGRVDTVRQANEEHLLPQLRYRQQEQGPWIQGYSDIFRQWIRKARAAYVDYATDFSRADHLVRTEMERNIEFRNFVDRCRGDRRSNRLPLDSFLKSPITRLQRYTLLLSTVLKTMLQETPEKTNLQLALDEIKAVASECDSRVAEQQRKIDLADLEKKLVLRPGMKKEVELNLDHFGRSLIHRGDLQRMGSSRFNWLDCHVLLFDHYLILTKTIVQRIGETGRIEKYDVSRLPIPMDLLVLDSRDEPAVQKSSYVKGLTSVREAAGRGTPGDPNGLARAPTNNPVGPGALQHVNTGASANTLHTVSSMGEGRDDKILYPFRIKHLGRDVYTLFASTEQARSDWCHKIIEAKRKHAAALHAQNAEPFRLRVMADSAFVYDPFGGSGRGVTIQGTPLDRAIKEVDTRFKDTGRPGPICRARVNCATSFSTPYPGKQMIAVGTDYGVFVSEVDNPRGWTKAINMQRVTQVAVLEEFNLFLLISDKSLIACHLDVICPTSLNGPTPANDSARKAPQKLSGSKDVGFFATGRMKDRVLVFYKKRENLNAVFKVLEPVYQKSSEKKGRGTAGIFKRGTTEFFREYDEFYIPTECTGMNLFHSSLAVSTARGFEVLTLDKKQPWSVPDLNAEHVQNIAQHVKDQRALRMLRLSEQEFLLCYTNCAVYINKHGDVSRSVIMRFVGSANHAALYGPYLVLFDNDFVEIRNAQNGRLKQIIAGREVKCLDDGTNWSANLPHLPQGANGNAAAIGAAAAAVGGNRTLKLVMQHPEMEKTQIVVELLLNDNLKE